MTPPTQNQLPVNSANVELIIRLVATTPPSVPPHAAAKHSAQTPKDERIPSTPAQSVETKPAHGNSFSIAGQVRPPWRLPSEEQPDSAPKRRPDVIAVEAVFEVAPL